jgi:hypothetical protein
MLEELSSLNHDQLPFTNEIMFYLFKEFFLEKFRKCIAP